MISILLSKLYVNAFINIYFGEVFACLIGLFFIYSSIASKCSLTQNKYEKKFLKLFVFWIIISLFTGIINFSSYTNFILGISVPAVSCLTFISLIVIFRAKQRRIIPIAIFFYSISGLLSFFLQKDEYSRVYPWKFGFGISVTLLVFLVITKLQKTFISIFLCLVLSYVSISNGYRSFAAIILFTLLIYLIIIYRSFKSNRSSHSDLALQDSKRISIWVLIAAAFVVYALYLNLAYSGVLSDTEIKRAEVLKSSSFGPVAGRSEFLINLDLIARAPLWGYGYDPKIDSGILSKTLTNLSKSGLIFSKEYMNFDGVMHSFILNSMMMGGILAGLFWITILHSAIKYILYYRSTSKEFDFASVTIVFLLIWGVLFSPYASTNRFISMLGVAIIATQLKGKKNETKL